MFFTWFQLEINKVKLRFLKQAPKPIKNMHIMNKLIKNVKPKENIKVVILSYETINPLNSEGFFFIRVRTKGGGGGMPFPLCLTRLGWGGSGYEAPLLRFFQIFGPNYLFKTVVFKEGQRFLANCAGHLASLQKREKRDGAASAPSVYKIKECKY